MKKSIQLIILTGLIGLLSCGGSGSGSYSTGGVYYSHSQLADEFVYRLYSDVGLDVSLVKTDTLQTDYIVVYDNDYGTYDAYYIGNYNVGEDLAGYLNIYDNDFFYDLGSVPGTVNTYEDWWTGIQFEETGSGLKDLEKVGALIQNIKNDKVAQKLAAEFGLSEDRAKNIAMLSTQWGKISKSRSMTEADANAFSEELLGINMNKIKDAYKKSVEGNDGDFENLIDEAAEFNETSPEGMHDLINNFLKQ